LTTVDIDLELRILRQLGASITIEFDAD